MATRFILAEAPSEFSHSKRTKRVARPTGKPVEVQQLVGEMLNRYPAIMAHLAE